MKNTDANLVAIVPAAGIGSRAGLQKGRPKQYRELLGEPMLRRSVKALLAEPRIRQVRVAVAPNDTWVAQALQGLPRTVWRACGGATRADTVRAALQDAALPPGSWVMVHDAARPGLPADALARLIDACLAARRGGLLAMPVSDTVKRASPDALAGTALAQATIARAGLWLAQTPQLFPAEQLLLALQDCRASSEITDEASAMESAFGYQSLLVPGARCNEKLTWPQDFEWFAAWLREQRAP